MTDPHKPQEIPRLAVDFTHIPLRRRIALWAKGVIHAINTVPPKEEGQYRFVRKDDPDWEGAPFIMQTRETFIPWPIKDQP